MVVSSLASSEDESVENYVLKAEEDDDFFGFAKYLLSLGCFSGSHNVLDDDDRGEPLDPPHPLDGVAATYDEANDLAFHRRRQIEQVRQSELLFLTEFRRMLARGSGSSRATPETPRLSSSRTTGSPGKRLRVSY